MSPEARRKTTLPSCFEIRTFMAFEPSESAEDVSSDSSFNSGGSFWITTRLFFAGEPWGSHLRTRRVFSP
jgi:hypothetical protein